MSIRHGGVPRTAVHQILSDGVPSIVVNGPIEGEVLQNTNWRPPVIQLTPNGGSVDLLSSESGSVYDVVLDGTGGDLDLPSSPPAGWNCRLIFSGNFASAPTIGSLTPFCPWYSSIHNMSGIEIDGPSVLDLLYDGSRWVVPYMVGQISSI